MEREVGMAGLGQRANILTRSIKIGDRYIPVIIYDDHRTLLNVLYYARMKNILRDAVQLIFFDYHDDAKPANTKTLDKLRRIPIAEKNFRDFWNIVEFDLSELDDDWLWAGMDYGLISNAVRVAGEEDSNVKKLNETFRNQHQLDLWKWEDLCGKAYEIFDQIEDSKRLPYVLDFDLDCFTDYNIGSKMAWSDDKFNSMFEDAAATRYVIRRFAQNAEFITICREPDCCGGILESTKILYYLDRYVFDQKLG